MQEVPPERVHTGVEVAEIKTGGDGVTLTTASGETTEWDHVIIALVLCPLLIAAYQSISATRGIERPPFQQAKQFSKYARLTSSTHSNTTRHLLEAGSSLDRELRDILTPCEWSEFDIWVHWDESVSVGLQFVHSAETAGDASEQAGLGW